MSEMNEQQTVGPNESEYKGKPILTLNPEDRFPFSFGVTKAKLILQYLDEIRAFVAKYDK